MRTIANSIYWLAGLVEGEGCLYLRAGRYLDIIIQTNDYDVMDRVARMLDAPLRATEDRNGKTNYRVMVHGARAIGWAMTMYSLLGSRRQKRIREALALWKSADTRRPGKTRAHYFRKSKEKP
jgi:hypothetical protein